MKKEKKPKLLQRLILLFFSGVILITFLGLLGASLLGINVFEKTKAVGEKVPFLSFIWEEKSKVNIEELNDHIVALEAQVQEKNVQIEDLKKQLEQKEVEKDKLMMEQTKLEHSIDELVQMKDEKKKSNKEIVETFQNMAPKRAAPIIIAMDDNEALNILVHLHPESLAKIMEKMPPEQAAKYSQSLAAKPAEGR